MFVCAQLSLLQLLQSCLFTSATTLPFVRDSPCCILYTVSFFSFSHHATFVSQTLLNYQMDYLLCSYILIQLIIQQILGYSIYSMGFAIKQAGVTAILFTSFGIRQFGIHSSVCHCKSTILQKRREKERCDFFDQNLIQVMPVKALPQIFLN